MGRKYQQLSAEERVKIYPWHAKGKSARFIGEALGRHASTITRELRRNSQPTKQWKGGYEPVRAEALAVRRRQWDNRHKLSRQPALRACVHDGLAMGWSPEQIAGRLALRHGSTVISHEAIYRFVYHCTAQKDYWHRLLPRQKYRRGHYNTGRYNPVEHIKNRVSIADRNAAVQTREHPGHWEADLMIFRNKKSNVLVAQERRTRFVFLHAQPDKKAVRVRRNLHRGLARLPPALRQTLTQDNGTEFAEHYKLAAALNLKTFFCDPRSPWQKGGVENANGRLRRWLPTTTPTQNLTQAFMASLAAQFNHTPRKCLGFKTPAELFSKYLLHLKRDSTYRRLLE